MTPPQTGFAPVNGLRLYYEIHGSGEPLLALHGGIGATELLGPNVAELAKSRQVIVAHMQGHGFTKDIDRPYACEQMADDVAVLMDHLGLRTLDVLGYSMGGGVALQLAIRHPERVKRLVLVSTAMARDGQFPEIVQAFADMPRMAPQLGAGVARSPLAKLYPDVDWPTSFRKIGEMEGKPWDWTAQVRAIKAPALLVFADADSIRPDHMMAMYAAFGGGQHDAGFDGSRRSVSQLAVLPGRTHYDIMQTTAVATLAEPFLASARMNAV